MKQFAQLTLFTLFLLMTARLDAQTKNILPECWTKQVKPVQSKYFMMSFAETRSELENSIDPWRSSAYRGMGLVWCNADNFLKQDSILTGRRHHLSKVQYNKSTLLFQNYDAHALSPVSKMMFANYLMQTARFSPIMMIQYFKEKGIAPAKESNNYYTLYKTTINKSNVSLFIRNADSIAYQITIMEDDELFGDVMTSINYNDYLATENLPYPSTIKITKLNGKVMDEVKISGANIIANASPVLTKPATYSYTDDINAKPSLSVEKYSDNIHFITLKHTDDKVMVVEFKDFLLVADAPLNTANGELIIAEAKKIAPSKPIKYFVYGHHHPHAIGGLRAFVHEGSKILCPQQSREFARYIAAAPHTLNPDILQQQPKAIQVDSIIGDSRQITDGKFSMNLYVLGSKSQHSSDYILYYFPSAKLLVENDLVWIRKTGDIPRASAKQVALYKAIKDLKLDVTTIIQSSPATNPNIKSVIPFDELEKSMSVK